VAEVPAEEELSSLELEESEEGMMGHVAEGSDEEEFVSLEGSLEGMEGQGVDEEDALELVELPEKLIEKEQEANARQQAARMAFRFPFMTILLSSLLMKL